MSRILFEIKDKGGQASLLVYDGNPAEPLQCDIKDKSGEYVYRGNFIGYLRYLAPQDKILIFNQLEIKDITRLAGTPHSLIDVLDNLQEDECKSVREKVIDAIVENNGKLLTDLIKLQPSGPVRNFSEIFDYLRNDERSRVFRAAEVDWLIGFIKSIRDLENVLSRLNQEDRNAVINVIIDNKFMYINKDGESDQLIKSPSDATKLFAFLDEAERKTVIDAMIKNNELAQRIVFEHTPESPDDPIEQFSSRLSAENAASDINILNRSLRADSRYLFSHPNPNDGIKALHEKLFALLSKPTNKRVAASRNDALQIIKREILHLLNTAEPGDIDKNTLDKATEFLSLHRNRFHLFGTASLSNPDYLKHRKYHDSQESTNTPPTTRK